MPCPAPKSGVAMNRAVERRARPRPNARRSALVAGLVSLGVLVLMLGSSAFTPTALLPSTGGARAPSLDGALPSSARAASAAEPASAAHAATTAFNPPCYPVYASRSNNVCVSIQNQGESQIVPIGSNTSSPVMPSSNVSLPLVVHSENSLLFTGPSGTPLTGPHAPIALNVTGTLWNGDPYYNVYDGSTWHSNGAYFEVLADSDNRSYPYQYLVNFSAKGTNGEANFFAGEQITWWIYLVFSTNNVSFSNHEGPHLTFTYAGSWPYSPDPGAPHYGGSAATDLDVNITATPRVPNWNDSVRVTVNTTAADIEPYNATIGACELDFVEITDGVVVVNTSLPFNVTVAASGVGNYSTSLVIPALYAQVQGARASYRIWITDTAKPGDQLVTPWTNYTVGGNGTFLTGIFASDIIVSMSPGSVLNPANGVANLTPGEPLTVELLSRSPTTAILAAEIQFTVAYPLLKETVANSFYLKRISSIQWIGALPGLPVSTVVNFTIYAWDFANSVEISQGYTYDVESFAQYVPPLSDSQSFFYVYIYDNGSHTWVQGAHVQITSVNGLYNSISNSTLGIAYANETGAPFDPLVLEANATYNVTVTDPRFVPGGAGNAPAGAISVDVLALPMTTMSAAARPLASTGDYVVLEQGDSILFYLNATAVGPVSSPSVSQGNALGAFQVPAVLGLLGALVAAFPLAAWWRQIKRRRTEEEKRVTL